MRILHWYPNFNRGGGVANAVLGLAAAQAQLRATVWIAAMKSLDRPLHEPMVVKGGVEVVEWSPWLAMQHRWRFRPIPLADVRQLRRVDPDVVHVHGEFNPDNLRVPRLFGCPIILSPHGGFHPEVFTRRRRAARSLYFQIAKHLLYRRVHAFHALSPAEREHIVRVLPHARVYCVPQGPNIRVRLSPLPDALPDADECVKFVFVGRLDVFTKGLDLLLEAFAAALRRLEKRQLTLTLAGPEWQGGAAWLRRRATELGIGRHLALPGALSGEEVASLLHRSDIYAQLSRHDGLPLSVSEALIAGKPIILSGAVGTASHPEVAALPHVRIVSLNVGEITEAMISFAHRREELRTIAAQHRERVREFFSWERVAAQQMMMYEEAGGGLSAERTSKG